MDDYIKQNKAAWEEAFDKRSSDWGADIVSKVEMGGYPFFNEDTINCLKKYDLSGKKLGQFCCNNGREVLSLVKSAGMAHGVGFDIAENQIAFANEKAKELKLPCEFIATNLFDIGSEYENAFDISIITIGALCWLKDLDEVFKIVSRCTKKGGILLINEMHPFTNMIPSEEDESFNPQNIVISYHYFEHEWHNTSGMGYITGKSYESKEFIDYTHSLSEIMGAMCRNGFVITDFKEFQYDIGGGCEAFNNKGMPLSMIIEAKKE